jgi:hypothetical protein
VKSLYASVGSVMAEVKAMRASVFDHAAENALYKHNFPAPFATGKPLGEDGMRSYDELAEEAAASQWYTN